MSPSDNHLVRTTTQVLVIGPKKIKSVHVSLLNENNECLGYDCWGSLAVFRIARQYFATSEPNILARHKLVVLTTMGQPFVQSTTLCNI